MSADFLLLPCTASLHIEYVNRERIRSSRLIDVKRFVCNSPRGHVQAFCHQRRMTRTFSYSGMVSVIDVATGEIIEPERLFLYLQGLYDADPARAFDRFCRQMRPLVDILAFIGYSDGRYSPSEQKIMAAWLLQISGISREFSDYALSHVKTWAQPDMSDFVYAAQTVNQQMPEHKAALLAQAAALIKADRKILTPELDSFAMLCRLIDMDSGGYFD